MLELSNELEVGDRMTINELAKIVNNLSNTVNGLAITVDGLAIEMREGFIQVNKRLDEHDAIFKRNNLK